MRKVQSKKMCTKTVSRNPGVAMRQGPKRPGAAKKDLPRQHQAKGDSKKPCERKTIQAKWEASKKKIPIPKANKIKDLTNSEKVENGAQKPRWVKAVQSKPSITKEKPSKNDYQTMEPKTKKTPHDPT